MANTERAVQANTEHPVSKVGPSGETANRAVGSAWKSLANGYHAARRSTTQAYGAVKQYANKAYGNSREYITSGSDFAGQMGSHLNEFARKQPVVAMATVFAVGYAATYLVGRTFTRKAPP